MRWGLQKQLSRAQKRRNQQAEKEAEREAELAAERDQQGESEKSAEARQLREMLNPLGLTIREIQVWHSHVSDVLFHFTSNHAMQIALAVAHVD